MGRRRTPLLLLPAVLGLLVGPAGLVDPSRGAAPSAAAGTLEDALDELSARVWMLCRGAGVAAEAEALRRELAAARERIAELEAGRDAADATVTRLRAVLARSRDEARVLGEQLEATQRELEGLDTMLAAPLAAAADMGPPRGRER